MLLTFHSPPPPKKAPFYLDFRTERKSNGSKLNPHIILLHAKFSAYNKKLRQAKEDDCLPQLFFVYDPL
jgi:hypothetical protein